MHKALKNTVRDVICTTVLGLCQDQGQRGKWQFIWNGNESDSWMLLSVVSTFILVPEEDLKVFYDIFCFLKCQINLHTNK